MIAQNVKAQQMHYACLVDILGRAGQLSESAKIIRNMPFRAGTMLCRFDCAVDGGRKSFTTN
jgi:hypothetical protein